MRAVASSDETAANRILSISDPGRPPAYSAGHPSPGISGFRRLHAAIFRLILARDLRGMKRSGRSLCQIHIPALQDFYGSDGTRTRDLRRDRPILVLPG